MSIYCGISKVLKTKNEKNVMQYGNKGMKKGGIKKGSMSYKSPAKVGKSMDARDSESYKKDAMVRKGVPNHVSA